MSKIFAMLFSLDLINNPADRGTLIMVLIIAAIAGNFVLKLASHISGDWVQYLGGVALLMVAPVVFLGVAFFTNLFGKKFWLIVATGVALRVLPYVMR